VSIEQNLLQLKGQIPAGVTLVAVSKTHPAEVVMQAYNAGQRVFGENRVQELLSKQPFLPTEIEWHLIGHLQTNKVKYIAPFVSLIHSVDSLKLLKEINKEAAKNSRVIDCLLQVYIAQEETKFGLYQEELFELIENPEVLTLNNCRIVGVMGMATFTNNENQLRNEFQMLKGIFDSIKVRSNYLSPYFNEISMGMSSDYAIAIEEGSTMIRVGSAIFGEREYNGT